MTSHQLSTDEDLDVYIQPGDWGFEETRFIDMGDGIIVSCMICDRRIVNRETGLDVTQALLVGRRLVAFRIGVNCEVTEIGPPTVCPGDTQYYYDDHYTHDVGDDGSDYFDGSEGIAGYSTVVKLSDNVVAAFALNGLQPQFPNGEGTVEDRYDATEGGFLQCIGWVARLNRANLTWDVGPKCTVQHHYYQDSADYFGGGLQGIPNDGQGIMGAVAMNSGLAVVALSMYEYGLADQHLDYAGEGDFTDQDLNTSYTNGVPDPADMEVSYIKLCALSVDAANLTMSLVDTNRITDRWVDGYFYRFEQLHTSGNRGVIIYGDPFENGKAAVWRHDGAGAFSSVVTSTWVDAIPQFPDADPTTEAEWAAWELELAEWAKDRHVNWEGRAHLSFYYGTCAKISDDLFIGCGSEVYFWHKFMHVLRLGGDDTLSSVDWRHLHGNSEFYSAQVVPVGEGWVWVSFRDLQPQKVVDEMGYPSLFPETAAIYPNGLSMALYHVDLQSGQVDDYVPLGTGAAQTRHQYGPEPTRRLHLGRNITAPQLARAATYGTDHVLIGNDETLTLLSPLAQTFPITAQEGNPSILSAIYSDAYRDLWYVDQTAYEPDPTVLDQIDHDQRVESYGGREP